MGGYNGSAPIKEVEYLENNRWFRAADLKHTRSGLATIVIDNHSERKNMTFYGHVTD